MAAVWGLCLAARAHGAWVYPEVESTTGQVRPGTLEARFAAGSNSVAVASNALEVHISGIRRKLGKPFIENARGLGYRVTA